MVACGELLEGDRVEAPAAVDEVAEAEVTSVLLLIDCPPTVGCPNTTGGALTANRTVLALTLTYAGEPQGVVVTPYKGFAYATCMAGCRRAGLRLISCSYDRCQQMRRWGDAHGMMLAVTRVAVRM